MTLDIARIIADGGKAPSGENCQPWQLRTSDDALYLYNDPSADTSLYNSKQKGSYVAHGAFLENVAVSSAQQGYTAQINVFPKESDPNLVASIGFAEGAEQDPLYAAISQRCTNRKSYTGETLSPEQKRLLQSAATVRDCALHVIDDKRTLPKLGAALAMNERILFENRAIHDFFYEHILWKESDQDARSGFFIDTLEFLPHQLIAVKLLRWWPLLRLLNSTIGMGRMIATENAAKYAASGTICAITTRGHAPKDFVQVGRAAERVWFTATDLGLAVHPCTGTLFFHLQIEDGGGDHFSSSHRQLIESGHRDLRTVFNVADDETIIMIMRIGKSDPPTARSHRRSGNIPYA